MYRFQRTIKNSISFSGIGLHTGEYTKINLITFWKKIKIKTLKSLKKENIQFKIFASTILPSKKISFDNK